MTTREKLSFTNSKGEQLAAILDRPDTGIRGYALFAHCFTCSKNITTATRIGTTLAEHGIAVLRFDFTGLGDSEGVFADTNLSSNIDDLVSAANFLDERFQAPALLIGHSLGGTAILAAAGQITQARALVTLAAPDDPAHLARLLRQHQQAIEQDGEARVRIGGQEFTITRQFMHDISEHSEQIRIEHLGKPLLLLHATNDELTGIDHAYRLFEQAREPKSIVSIEGADHLLSNPEHAEYAANIIAAWVRPYLPA